MFAWLRSLVSAASVVELHSSRFRVRDLSAGVTFEFEPILATDGSGASERAVSIGRPIPASAVKRYEPFASPASFARDRRIAELLLQHAYSRLGTSRWLKPAPKVVLCVSTEPDNAIRGLDDEALLELSRRAGARMTVVHRGKSLADREALRLLDAV